MRYRALPNCLRSTAEVGENVNVDSTSTGKRKEELKCLRAPPGCHPALSPPEEEPVLDQRKHSYSRV